MNSKLFAGVLALTLFACGGQGAGNFDWPQWQGPERTAHSKETGLLEAWPKDGPPLAWKATALGGGDSSPSIANGHIYGMSTRGQDEVVWALSEKDGKEIWAVKVAPALRQNFHQSQEGPSATPTVDGDRLYVVGLAGNVACLQAADGKVLWQRSFVTDFGGSSPMWSFRESPLVDGDKVICTPGSQDAMLVALDKLTGQTVWKTTVPVSTNSATRTSTPGGGGGGGGRGGFGGFSIASTVGPQMFSQADANKDQKVSRPEFTALADTWFDKLAPETAGQVPAAQFAHRFYEAVPRAEHAAGAGASAPRTPSRSAAPAFVTAADTDKDGSVTRVELKDTFTKWYDQWDADKTGALTEEKLRAGLNAALPAPQLGAGRGFGGGGGGAGGGGRGFGGRGGGNSAGAGYSSPIAIEFEGQRQYVQFTSKGVIGVAAADGKLLWRYDRPANGMGINISTPFYHEGRVFAASAYGAGGGVVKLSKEANGGIKAEEVWFSRNMENHHGGVVLIDGTLFGANGGNGGGYPVALDFQTGDVLWNEKDADKRRLKKGSVAVADGRIYYRAEEGPIVLLEPSRKEYLERGRFEQPDRTRLPAWAHPVIANGKLYIRDQDTLYCYDVKAK